MTGLCRSYGCIHGVLAGGVYSPEIQDSFIYVFPPTPVVSMNITLECFAYGT